MKTVNILGTDYNIHFVDEFPDYLSEVGENAGGLCNRHDRDIWIKRCNDKDMTATGRERCDKDVLRHEIIHACLRVGCPQMLLTTTDHGQKMKRWWIGLQSSLRRYSRHLKKLIACEAIVYHNKRFGYAGAPVAGITDKLQNNKICVSCY